MRISDWSSDVCSSDLTDPVWHRLDKHAQEGCRGKLGRPAIDAGEHQLRGAVHFDIEEASSAFIAQFRDIDVEVANLIFLELLRSEEHTSELQSLMRISYAVFCLKKKKKTSNNTTV